MVYRCKVCGGELNPKDGQTVVKCEYCGNINAIPKNVDDNQNELLNRADELRRNCEFDSAEKAYEKIIDINPKEADAYWGWILSHYGIEYVKDPATGKRLPTCHRASFDAITADFNFKQALKYADALQRPVYEEEARVIDAIQKEILSISQKEEPYDVFICYKETDSFGQRTQDSVIANDIYYQLTQQGYKVFYAAITLEDKLGQDYEPIIFAALNSAKVMLVVGSKPEYFNAVWVRNEWSRFLKLMKSDRSKQLYPCYKGMNPYDLPEEFSHLQAQDMGKIGFINDIVRGIQKVIIKKQPESKTPEPKQNKTVADDKISPILKRAFLFCEDSQWNNANQYFEKVLDRNPENAEAYVGKLMIDLKVCRREQLCDQAEQFNLNGNFKKAYRFADDALKQELDDYLKKISDKIETRRLDGLYSEAVSLMKRANTAEDYNEAKNKFSAISSWKDSAAKAKQCYEKSEELRKSKIYADALALLNSKDAEKIKQAATLLTGISDYKDSTELLAKIPELCEIAKEDEIYFSALKKYESNDIETIKAGITEFKSIENWRDSKNKIQESLTKIETLQEKAKKEREERERIAREKEIARVKRNKKIKKISIISAIIAVVLTAVMVLTFTVIVPTTKLKNADALVNNGKYDKAIKSYEDLGDYKDSGNKICFLKALQNAKSVMNGSYDDAIKEMLESGATVTINYATEGGSFELAETVQTLSLSVKNLSETSQDKSNTRVYRTIDEFSGLDAPARNGYNFVKWNLTDSKPSVSIGSISVTLNLTAEWNAKAYAIEYELGGGSVNGDNPLGYDAKDDDFTLINPTKVGYTFIGWSGTDIVGTSTSVTIASGSYGNRKFTAKWQVNNYTLTYDANGGESSETVMTVTYDADYTLADANRTGYEFKGWFDKKGTKFDNGVWKIADDVTLIAKWEILTYSVTYNLYGGNASNNATYTIEDSFTLNNPFKTGYTFLGWTYEGQSTPVLSVTIDKEIGNKEYTANYKANTYTITFDADGGVLDKNSLSVTYDADYVLPHPEKDGYSFDGWYDGDTKIDNGVWKFDKNVSLKAKWVIYTLTTNANNEKAGTYTVFTQEKVTVDKKVSLEATTNDGYIFIGWCDGETVLSAELHYTFDMPDKTITYTAKWDKIPYTICYHNLDGATNNKANPFDYNVESDVITLLPAAKVGYTFDGWFIDNELSKQRLDIKTGSVGNIDLYAKWHANEYAVKFNENGGSKVEDKTATFDSDFMLPTISRKGYTFNGWYNSDVKYESEVWKTPSDVTLTAKWTVITYNISYDLNGGTASNRSTYTVDDTFTLNNPTKIGYTFLGWAFNGQSVPQLTVTISDEIEDKSFTANYQANEYLVSFDAGIGSVTPSEKTAIYDSEFELPVPTRVGYDFSGWFNENTEYKNGIWKTPEAITLTAKWTARNDTKYTVNYCLENADDSDNTVIKTNILYGTSDTNITPEVISYTGFTSPAAQTVNIDADGSRIVNYYYKRITQTIAFVTNGGKSVTTQTYKYEQTIALPSSTRENFTFGGWFTDETQATEFMLQKMPLNDITVYAWWCEENKACEFTYSGSSSFTINGFNGNGEKLWVPSYIGDKPVTEIKTSAFEYKTDITKVVIPDTVTSIGKGAFKGCESIIDITLPFVGESLNATYYNAVFGYIFDFIQQEGGKSSDTKSEVFINIKYGDISGAVWQYTCQNYYHSYYGGGSYYAGSYYYYIPSTIKNVTITVQNKIPLAAFNGCDFIESITIPTTVTSIGDYAFQNCTVLKRLNSTTDGLFNIPKDVTKINQYAFKGCDEITKVVIPANIKNIDAYAFNSCSQFVEVEFAMGSKLETIGDYAFADCVSITELQLPSTITGIGDYAFSGCISIAKIDSETDGEMNLPENVTKIGMYAFQNLELMTKIGVPDTVMSIGLGAFKGCESIIDITLPFVGESLNATYYNAVFGYIFGFTQQEGGKSSGTKSEVFINIKYGDASGAVWQYTCQNYYHSYYGGGSYYAGSYYYYIPSTIKNVTITVQNEIPTAAFNGCSFIESITVPANVSSIGECSFQDCIVLKRLNSTTDGLFNIPMGIAKINQCAFKGFDEITKVVIPANVTNIAAHAFNSCSQLKDVEFATGSKLETIGDYAFADCVSITELQLPSTITGIGEYAFKGCISITKINSETDGEMILPENVTKIGAYAFQNLELMTKIVIPDTVIGIGNGVFKGCSAIEEITLPFVGNTATAIAYNAVFGFIFDYDKYKSDSSGYTWTYENTMYGPKPENTIWQYSCGTRQSSASLYYKTSYFYYIPTTIRKVTITVQTVIPTAAFNGCDFIKNITIPTTVTSIGEYAFQNCTATVNQDYVPKFSYWNGTDVSTSFLGSGTVEDPYRLNSAADLAYLATSVNSGEGYSGKYFTLNVDINLNNKSWTPIGNKQHPFAGVFNGNGKKIYNLSINGDLQYVGLFGYVTGTVMNIGIDSGTIAPITSGASAYVGSIVGCVSGLIENCYSKATINVNVKNMVYAGGLVGHTESTAIIRNSFSSGNIKIISSDSMAYAGGFVGNNKGKIIGCLAYGNVMAKGSSESYSRNGGLIGNSTGTITDCYRSKLQVLTKYTTVGAAVNEEGVVATEAEMLEYCKANWGNEWDYSSSRPQLRR